MLEDASADSIVVNIIVVASAIAADDSASPVAIPPVMLLLLLLAIKGYKTWRSVSASRSFSDIRSGGCIPIAHHVYIGLQ
jgi:hypothetical protein